MAIETLLHGLTKAFGWGIINSLWQSAILYGILFLILYSLPKMASKYRHNLAFGTTILMFASFCYSFIKNFNISTASNSSLKNIDIEAYQYLNNLPISLSIKAEQYFPVIFTFYIIGICLQLFVIIKGYSKLSILKTNKTSLVPDSWKTIFDTVSAGLNIKKTTKFYLSEIVNVPLVVGYLKPVVLFPIALVNHLENDQVEAILIHELSHIRRNDFLLNLIKTTIETLLFFNPFVWMTSRFIHIEREHACDDLVLKHTGKPLNYAHALLKLELLQDKSSPAFALAVTGKNQNLYQRIKRITNMKTNYLNVKQQMAALTLGIACLFSIAWVNPYQQKNSKKVESREIITVNTIIDTANKKIRIDTNKKSKVIITVKDKNGNKTTYKSFTEVPDSLKLDLSMKLPLQKDSIKTIIIQNFDGLNPEIEKHIADMTSRFDSKEWQDKIIKAKISAEKMAKNFNSAEWKKQQEEFKIKAKEIEKKFNSPEWRDKIAKIELNAEVLAKKFNSPEWKANIEKIQKNAEEMDEKFNSPEWKEKMQEIKNLYNSKEYIELKQKFDKEVEKLKEQKNKQAN
jgi:bla regulator protein BlaR1